LNRIFNHQSIAYIILLFATICNSADVTLKKTANYTKYKVPLTGFNINWSFLPVLNDKFINVTKSLKPKIIRYPGGTISNSWDWQQGLSTKYPRRAIHKIEDLVKMQKGTNADVIFVLNVISSTFKNQLELLKNAQKLGISIKYIEIGNEQYLSSKKFGYNVKKFPSGKDYAKYANTWAAKLKKEFPRVKIGIVLLGRTNKNPRLQKWNSLVIDNIKAKNYDAFIYHIYLKFPNYIKLNPDNIARIIHKRIKYFEKSKVSNPKKQIWITEYGAHANSEEKTVEVTAKLADYIDSIADISMAHILFLKTRKRKYSFFSMISTNNETKLTKLGQMFKTRINAR